MALGQPVLARMEAPPSVVHFGGVGGPVLIDGIVAARTGIVAAKATGAAR